jgi:hypothetical protein
MSHDGRTLVWFHRENAKAFLCVMTAPWDKPPRKVAVPSSLVHNHVDPVRLSGDGCHAFVNGQHVEIVDGVPASRGRLPGPISYFGGAPNFDGSKVAAPLDSKVGGMKLLLRKGDRYVESTTLTPAGSRRAVMRSWISADGNRVVYTQDWGLRESAFVDGVWKRRSLALDPKLDMMPRSMSADGRTLLLQGIRRNRGRTAENIYLSSRNAQGRWPKPTLFLDSTGHTVYNCTMSPDANTVVWVHYTRDGKGGITRTESRFIRRRGDGWTNPSTFFDRKGFVQFMTIALSNADIVAYALADRSKPPGSCNVFLRPDLKPQTHPISINQRMVSKGKKTEGEGF